MDFLLIVATTPHNLINALLTYHLLFEILIVGFSERKGLYWCVTSPLLFLLLHGSWKWCFSKALSTLFFGHNCALIPPPGSTPEDSS